MRFEFIDAAALGRSPNVGFSNNVVILGIIVLINVPIYLLLGKAFFGSWGGFLESFIAIISPIAVSEDSRIGRFTLLMFVLFCLAFTAAEYHVVAKFFLGIEHPWG